jgi:hypothetical protein
MLVSSSWGDAPAQQEDLTMSRFTSFVLAVTFAVACAACGRSDTGITASIQTKFAQDDLVKAHEINVTTQDRVVTLNGDVESVAAKEQAVRLARDTEGVRDVIDQLRVTMPPAATSGSFGSEIREGAEAVGSAIQKGAEATADAAKKAGKAIEDAVTDKDRDTDKDGR